MRKCDVEGCDNKHSGKGFCAKHYQRWLRYGDPHHKKKEQDGGNYLDKRGITKYKSQHKVLARRYGSAKLHDCSVCYEPAQNWALVKEWVPEGEMKFGKSGFMDDAPFSTDDGHYITLCATHHGQMDRGKVFYA